MRDTKGPSGLTRDQLLARCGMSDQARELVDAHIEAELTDALLSGAIGRQEVHAWREVENERAERERQTRWEKTRAKHAAKRNDPVQQARLKAYLDELVEVGRKHGLSLGHEDEHGSFLVYEQGKGFEDWLEEADWGYE